VGGLILCRTLNVVVCNGNKDWSGGRLKLPVRIVEATQVHVMRAKLVCMRGNSILLSGLGCRDRMTKAKRVLGPHSLEWGE
jgi:hypothetical protein